MVLMKNFKTSKDDDYENMSVITGSMRLVLKALDNNLIPHKQYTEQELISFCKSIICSQKSDGSWPVHKLDFIVSEEDKVDFVFFPTQIACSILSYVKQNNKDIKLEGVDEALKKGLNFSVSNKLEGFGFNSIFQKIESLIIFIEGDVPQLLCKNSEICPSLHNLFIEVKKEIQNLVDTNNTVLEFGGDYKEQYEFVLNGLGDLYN